VVHHHTGEKPAIDLKELDRRVEELARQISDRVDELSRAELLAIGRDMRACQMEFASRDVEMRRLRQELTAVRERHENLEEQFRTSVEAVFVPVSILAAQHNDNGEISDFVFRHVNEACIKAAGHNNESLIGHQLSSLFPQPEDVGLFDILCRVVETGEAWETEKFRYPRFCDGQERMLRLRATKWQDGIALAWEDVTEPKQWETEREQLLDQTMMERNRAAHLAATLEHERDILAIIMENTHAMLAYLDPDFNFVLANSAYCKGSDYTEEELIGRNHFDLFPHEENEAIFRRVRDTGQPVRFNAKPFEFPDHPEWGVTYWDWTLVPVLGEQGKVKGLVFSLFDVTPQKVTEQKLRESEKELRKSRDGLEFRVSERTAELVKANETLQAEIMEREKTQKELSTERQRLYTLLEEIPAYVYVCGKDYLIKFANRHFRELFGESIGKSCYETLYGFSMPCPVCYRHGIFETKQPVERERAFADGTYYQVHDYLFTDVDGSENIMELGFDITPRKRLEKQVIQTEKLAAVAQMSAMISHEFRNALTSVKMILELQQESQNLMSSERESLGVALSSINHMEMVVSQLINFSRPSSPVFRLRSLRHVVQESLKFVEPQIAHSGITLKRRLATNLPDMLLDPLRLKEAFVNLLLNAIQAINQVDDPKRPREISVTTRSQALTTSLDELGTRQGFQDGGAVQDIGNKADMESTGETRWILIRIKDTGRGIPQENLSRIFDPFFTTRASGTGLGLSVVKRTVNDHGGVIRVTSSPQNGTEFSLFLPVKTQERT
jgi:PAS domain S-box-containing protein